MPFVGVLDSGIGGLTVLSRLAEVAPQCDFVYLADHAFCPYGTRPQHQIKSRVLAVASFLRQQGALGIVVACNTASVFANDLRAQMKIPVWDVISPTCRRVAQVTQSKRVALLATNATVGSGAYQRRLQARGIAVHPFLCSSFVPLVEENAPEKLRQQVVAKVLDSLPAAHADVVILGCTHFPFLRQEIAPFCGNATIIWCDGPVAQDFLQSNPPKGNGKRVFWTTGNANLANSVAKQWGKCGFAKVKI